MAPEESRAHRGMANGKEFGVQKIGRLDSRK